MFSKRFAGAFALSCFFNIVTPSLDYSVDRIPMGGAVLYSRQGSDCPSYGDCTCEEWGMSCDLLSYEWYDCSDTSIAAPGNCGAASASSSGLNAPSSTGVQGSSAPPSSVPSVSSISPSSSVPETTTPPSTTEKSFTTGQFGVTLQPGDCPNDGVRQNAPYCPTSTAATSFSCQAGSNIGAATFTPATWCGCNDGKSYPTMASASAPCAYATAPPASLEIHPSAVPQPTTTVKAAPSTTAFDPAKTILSCGATWGPGAEFTSVPRAQTNKILKSIEEFCTPQDPDTLTLVKDEPAYHDYDIDSDVFALYELAFWWDPRPECADAPAPSIVASVPKGPSYWCNQYFDQIVNTCDAGEGQDKRGGTLAVDCAIYGMLAYLPEEVDDGGLGFGGARKREIGGQGITPSRTIRSRRYGA